MRHVMVAMVCLTQPLAAQTPDDRHLPVVARTAAEVQRVARALAPPDNFARPEPFEAMSAGAATVRATLTADAFSMPSANMPPAREMDFKLGNGLFRKTWIAAPATTRASDGLGPLYNARACQDCHIKDGRGHISTADDVSLSLIVRISLPGGTDTDAIAGYLQSLPDPTYGSQLQTFASPGHLAEGRLQITTHGLPVTLGDGTVITLHQPAYAVATPAFGPLHPNAQLSPRLAPQMIGLGLLEAIPAADILARVDEKDTDADGISGRANIVPSPEFGIPMLGRFGLKAGLATIREQSAAAFSADMGLSTSLHPLPWGDCTALQTACIHADHGQEPGVRDGREVDDASLDLVTFYARNLGVPARRNVDDAQVLRGKAVFHAARCAACHTPKHVTNRLESQPEQSFQLIWPFTDLLLHDMGPALADNRPEGRATGQEWRTPPLWGIGLTQQVNGRATFLHDGRARTLLEAILWHGGEAQAARDTIVALPKADRDALIAFLESL